MRIPCKNYLSRQELILEFVIKNSPIDQLQVSKYYQKQQKIKYSSARRIAGLHLQKLVEAGKIIAYPNIRDMRKNVYSV